MLTKPAHALTVVAERTAPAQVVVADVAAVTKSLQTALETFQSRL